MFFSIYPQLWDLVTYCKEAITFFASKQKTLVCFELFLFKLPTIMEIVTALQIPFDATNELQNVSFTLSDFYGCWLAIERRLTRLAEDPNQTTDFAKTLLEKIGLRKSMLLNNQALVCSVYLDKRYSFKLSADEKEIAILALQKLYERMKKPKNQLSLPVARNEKEDSFEDDCVKSGMQRKFHGIGEKSTCSTPTAVAQNFRCLIEPYEAIDREHNKNTLKAFWDEYKNLHPELYELATIVHSIPPTQATVERSFSVFGYIFDCRRTRLARKLLPDILMVNLNKHFVDLINDRELEQL